MDIREYRANKRKYCMEEQVNNFVDGVFVISKVEEIWANGVFVRANTAIWTFSRLDYDKSNKAFKKLKKIIGKIYGKNCMTDSMFDYVNWYDSSTKNRCWISLDFIPYGSTF